MPITDSLSSGNPITLLADVVVVSEFKVAAGARVRRRRGRVQLADLCPATRREWTFDERQPVDKHDEIAAWMLASTAKRATF